MDMSISTAAINDMLFFARRHTKTSISALASLNLLF
jgi:hypothetical protein